MYRTNSAGRLAAGDNKENLQTPKSINRKARSDSAGTKKDLVPTNVKIVLRVRGSPEDGEYTTINGDRISCKNNQFEFNKILNASTTQEETYNSVVENAAEQCLRGFNFCVLAYGQTGSGKTHSMSGTEKEPGIIPRFCDDLFTQIKKKNAAESVYVSLSFFEIYNEKVYDLLSSERKPLRVRGADNANIIDLTSVGVQSKDDLNKWRKYGVNRRATAATLIHELSSRSHAIFQLTIRRELTKVFDGVEKKKMLVSHCFFVDLAGSEKLSATSERQTETIHINKSLFALQRVVDARSSRSAFVNYRESLLTRVLKPCFSGNSISVILATIYSKESHANETVSTLRFVSKASKIEQKPVANEDKNSEQIECLVAGYKKEIEELHERLASLNNAAVVDTPVAPCLIELFEDHSLNLWKELKDYATIQGIGGIVVAKFIFNAGDWNVVAKHDGVMINGVVIPEGGIVTVKHGDGIVVNGQKYFGIYLNPDDDPKTFTSYAKVKVEYVTAQYEAEKERMVKEAIAEMKKEESDVKAQMEEEIKQMREELKIMKKREQESNHNPEIVKEREEAERMLLDCEEMKKNLYAELAKTEKIIQKTTIDNVENPSEKEKLMETSARVQLMNSVFGIIGKSSNFIFRVQRVQNNETVRIFNKKFKLYADIVPADFDVLYHKFAEIYQSSLSKREISGIVETFLYGDKLIWKNARGKNAHSSNLFQTAVINSLQETAKKRRSTVNDVRRTLTTRRSVLVEHIKDGNNEAGTPLDEMLSFFCLYFQDDASQVVNTPESNIAGILDCCLEARNHFQVFSGAENFMNAPTAQKKAMSVVGLSRSISSTKLISTISSILAQQKESFDYGIDHFYRAIFEHAQIIRRAIDSWINACKESQPTEGQIGIITKELDQIEQFCGHIAFLYAQKTVPRHDALKPNIFLGYNSAIDEFFSDLSLNLEGGVSLKRRILKLFTEALVKIKNIVDSQKSYNEDLVLDVLRTAILIKEQIKTKTDDKLIHIVPKLEEWLEACIAYESIIGNDLVNFIKGNVMKMEDLTKLGLMPPLPVMNLYRN